MQQPLTDNDLIAALTAGDTEALGELARRHQQRVLSLAERMLGRHDQAEDVCQEAFLRVYQAAATFVPKARFSTWLYRITVNLCCDALRRRGHEACAFPAEPPAGDWANPCQAAQLDELGRRVRKAVLSLPQRQKVAVVLHRYQQLTHAEIAEVMQCSGPAVESLLVRAYEQLRRDLREFIPQHRREDPSSNVSVA